MSWRETLGMLGVTPHTEHASTRNSHNTQKSPGSNPSATRTASADKDSVAADSLTQFTHNSQKPPEPDPSADYADYVNSASRNRDSEQADSQLLEALAEACRGLPITPGEVREAFTPEDIEEWHNGCLPQDTLATFAQALVQRREMDKGKRPALYTEPASCQHCGPVWLWFSGEVQGCPWCWNRIANRPIPRPQPVRCGGCAHFQRIDHPHLGHCAQGEPEGISGLWDTDRRHCERYLPRPEAPNDSHSRWKGLEIKGEFSK
ncbi:hypothetical protein [Nitrosococcus wardiae]|uniref:Uncharacterized protein n=1 Tax=Nitrosococcus wardiae TaxID=1814290 RepID=A0A4P7C3G0_9GAMM|nr:hypothetical protein [Nitrosococcus wardiae]QBQ56114.1 hypothetical protein E3U44_17555 [Nitrosococcus wardiae]